MLRKVLLPMIMLMLIALVPMAADLSYAAGGSGLPASRANTNSSANVLEQSATRTFPETGHTVSGRFLQYWQEHGGLAQQGYPISEEMQEVSATDGKTYTMQYFERAVFEMHPENQAPNDVLLSLLGAFRYNDKYPQGAPGQHASPDNPEYFPETKHTLGGEFRKYWETHGGLAQQGYPISDEFVETSDLNGKPYLVQYFQRAVFELHPENAGTDYQVLLSQLGKYRLVEVTTPPTPTPTKTATPKPAEATPTPVKQEKQGYAVNREYEDESLAGVVKGAKIENFGGADFTNGYEAARAFLGEFKIVLASMNDHLVTDPDGSIDKPATIAWVNQYLKDHNGTIPFAQMKRKDIPGQHWYPSKVEFAGMTTLNWKDNFIIIKQINADDVPDQYKTFFYDPPNGWMTSYVDDNGKYTVGCTTAFDYQHDFQLGSTSSTIGIMLEAQAHIKSNDSETLNRAASIFTNRNYDPSMSTVNRNVFMIANKEWTAYTYKLLSFH